MVFSANGAVNSTYSHTKGFMKLEPYLTPQRKINPKDIKDLKCKT